MPSGPASGPRPSRRRWQRRPAMLQLVGIGFAAIAGLQGIALLGAALPTGTVGEAANLTLPFPAEPLGAMAPAAGPERTAEAAAGHVGAMEALPDAPEPWAETSDRRCEPRLLRALEEQRQALEASLGQVEQADEAELARLVAIYESMKPKEAARIFEAMPATVAAGFIRRMREAKSAVIMANLGASHAYAITLALATTGQTARE